MARSGTSVEHSRPAVWTRFAPGDRLTVVKLAPDGAEAARYPAEVMTSVDAESWLAVRAIWTQRRVELDGLTFCPGDTLIEWFSPEQPFNAFAVLSPERLLKGWYANVTFPAWIDETSAPPSLFWHDLYLDLVGLPGGTFTIRDVDELSASGMQHRDPQLYARVLRARDELIRRFAGGFIPFAGITQIPQ